MLKSVIWHRKGQFSTSGALSLKQDKVFNIQIWVGFFLYFIYLLDYLKAASLGGQLPDVGG